MQYFRNNRGATGVEFALVALPIVMLILGIMQFGYIVYIDNVLNIAVHAAARCAAVGSTTTPCNGSGFANMQSTANQVFEPLSGATFSNNAGCSGGGLVGTYHVNVLFANLTLIAKSCYPTVIVPS
jgi:Flp pilus assembly protein TadG